MWSFFNLQALMTVPATKILVGLLAFLVIATYHQSEIFPNKHNAEFLPSAFSVGTSVVVYYYVCDRSKT